MLCTYSLTARISNLDWCPCRPKKKQTKRKPKTMLYCKSQESSLELEEISPIRINGFGCVPFENFGADFKFRYCNKNQMQTSMSTQCLQEPQVFKTCTQIVLLDCIPIQQTPIEILHIYRIAFRLFCQFQINLLMIIYKRL